MNRILHSIFVLLSLVFVSTPATAQYECVEGDCVNGKGKLVVQDGQGSLEGEFWEGQLIDGKVVRANGDVEVGIFQNHKLVQGEKRFHNGSILKGTFQQGVLVQGTVTDKDGNLRSVHVGGNDGIAPTLLPMHMLPPMQGR